MLSTDEIDQFLEWSKVQGIEFRKFEIQRANKKQPTKPWRLLFFLFRSRIATDI